MGIRGHAIMAVGALALFVGTAHAQEDPTERARAEFVFGVKLAGEGKWGDALGAFERSMSERPHALTLYNIATCERALGAYTRALWAYTEAERRNQTSGSLELSPSFAEEGRARSGEIERMLVHVAVTVAPADAQFAVDGRPVAPGDTFHGALLGGLSSPGMSRPPSPTFELLLDPGPHVFMVERKGFETAVVRRDLSAHARTSLDLTAHLLPGTMAISASKPAIIRVDGIDVGAAPVALSRPAGLHSVELVARGFVPYHTTVNLRPGEESNLNATLTAERPAITTRWWFWTGIGAIVAGAAIASAGVYFATRSPTPPDGGGLGWVVPAQ